MSVVRVGWMVVVGRTRIWVNQWGVTAGKAPDDVEQDENV